MKKIYLITALSTFLLLNLSAQTTKYIIDYSYLTTNTNCNVFANPVTLAGYVHRTSYGTPYYDNTNYLVNLKCGYYSSTQQYSTEYNIPFAFKSGYKYSISVYARSTTTDFAPFISVLMSNGDGSNTSANCTGPALVPSSKYLSYGSSPTNPSGLNWTTEYTNYIAPQNYSYLLIAGFPTTSTIDNSMSIVSVRAIQILETPPPPSCGYSAVPSNITGLIVTNNSSTSVSLNWNASSNATSYLGYYFEPATGINTSTNSVTLNGLTPGTNYTYNLVANNCKGSSSLYSSSFTTLSSCATPGTPWFTSGSGSSTLNWVAVTGAASYDVQYTIYPQSGSPIIGSVNTSTNSFIFTHSLAPSGSEIIASVRTRCSNGGISSWSNSNNTVQTYDRTLLHGVAIDNFQSSSDSLIYNKKLVLYPVPATASVTASFSSKEDLNGEIFIVNQLGSIVFRKVIQSNKGINNILLDVSSLNNGIYFFKLAQAKEITVRKLIIQK